MDNNQKFESFLESLKGNGQDKLIESIKSGFQTCFESRIDDEVENLERNYKESMCNMLRDWADIIERNDPKWYKAEDIDKDVYDWTSVEGTLFAIKEQVVYGWKKSFEEYSNKIHGMKNPSNLPPHDIQTGEILGTSR